MAVAWRCIPCSKRQIRLDVVLPCGQSFRWQENDRGEWLGVLHGGVWRLKQDETHVYYQVYCKETSPPHSEKENKLIKEDSKEHLTDIQTNQTPLRQTRSKASCRSVTCRQEELPANINCRLLHQVRVKQEIRSENVSDAPQKSWGKTLKEDVRKDLDIKSEPQDNSYMKMEKVPRSNKGSLKSEPAKTDDPDSGMAAILRDYLQLDVDTDKLYQQWSRSDPYFKKTASEFWGIRLLRQDPVENLFSFICSSNNNIARISSMVEKLCIHYGDPVAEVDGHMYHSFPSVATLAQPGVEEKLKELGFGYRAKFIAASASYILQNHGEGWVSSLRHCSYEEARTELMKLCGVGAKVADCVCLMSLDKPEAIPVDTHVWQFAVRHYLPKMQSVKSVTDKVYLQTADYFRTLWGQYAGWAQAVLFTAELPHMQSMRSPVRISSTSSSKKRTGKSTVADIVQQPKRAKASKKK